MRMADLGPAIMVPYHLDEPRPHLRAPVTPEVTVSVDLPEADSWQRMAVLYDQVAASVARAVESGGGALVVSGDCTTSYGVMTGLQRAGLRPSIVWLDGHGDVQTLETTTSGYLGGMPLRVLTGYRPELVADRIGLDPVPEDHVVLVDARDLDPPERAYLDTAPLRRCEVAELTAATVPDGPVYLHVDLDVVDPGEVPGLLFPAPGGPSLSEVAVAVQRVLDTGRVAAVGLACTWSEYSAAAEVVRMALKLDGCPRQAT